MHSVKRKWRRLRLHEKAALIAAVLFAAALPLFILLRFTYTYFAPLSSYLVAMTLLLISLCVLYWRKNRKPALACLSSAILTGLAYMAVFCL